MSVIALILILVNLLHPSFGAVSDADGADDADEARTNAVDDDGDSSRAAGGLRWRDLGVSLEPCAASAAALALDEDDNDNNGRPRRRRLDDSDWLLHPSSGFIKVGSLCGVIGPSGAGKTSFLSALGGTTPRGSGVYLTGSVWYEECPPGKATMGCHRCHLSQQEGDIALLSQHDNFFSMLTPRESLEFAAYLESQKQTKHSPANKGGNSRENHDHKQRAERKLASLGLLGVADRRIGDQTKIDGGGRSGHLGNFGWGRMTIRGRSELNRRSGGGLSGGERRRLSVALELITEPKIFLADEPTTGLDSSQAEKVVRLISTLARERNVPSVCTLHQPKSSIWRTLDQIILLAPGGKMCYAGDRENAIAYFKNIGYECPENTNPAEFFIDLVTIDTDDPAQALIDEARIDLLHHRFLQSCITDHIWPPPDSDSKATAKQQPQNERQLGHTTKKRLSSLYRLLRTKVRNMVNGINRFGALLQRSWRQNIRDGRVIMIRLGASVLQAWLFSNIFKSVRSDKSLTGSIADRIALLTYGVINMSIMALMKTLDLFGKERSVVVREQMRSNYSSLEYLLAKVFAEIPLDSFFALVFATILKHLTGLRSSMLTLMKTYCLMTVTSVSLGFAIGSVTSSVESAMSAGIPVMVIFMVVGIINPSGASSDNPPSRIMEWLKLGSPIKWAIEALVTAEFRGMVFGEKERGRWGQLEDLPRWGALAMVRDGDNILKNLGLGTAEYPDLMKNLAMLSGFYLLMSWFGLSYFGPSFIDTEAV